MWPLRPWCGCANIFLFDSLGLLPKILEGHKIRNAHTSPLPYTYINAADLPQDFSWANVGGVSYLTHSLNQVRVGRWVDENGAVELAGPTFHSHCHEMSELSIYLFTAEAAGLMAPSHRWRIGSRSLGSRKIQVPRSISVFSMSSTAGTRSPAPVMADRTLESTSLFSKLVPFHMQPACPT